MSITEHLDRILANPDGKHVDVLCGAGISLDSGLPIVGQFLGALFDGLDIDDFVDDGLNGLRASIKNLCARLPFEAIPSRPKTRPSQRHGSKPGR